MDLQEKTPQRDLQDTTPQIAHEEKPGVVGFIRNNLLAVGAVGVVGIAALAWLAFGFLGIQAAFIDNEVDEDLDNLFGTVETVEAAPAEETVEAQDATEDATATAPVEEPAAEPVEEPAEEPANEVVAADVPADAEANAPEAIAEVAEEEPAVEDVVEATAPPETDAPETAAEPETTEAGTPGEVVTLASGSFTGVNDYSVAGTASVLNDGTERRFLTLSEFASDNGPDLKVYLRAADGSFVSLGDLTGNIGDQAYEIPADVDLSVFNTVDIWCERFSAGFGLAPLS